MDSEIEKHYGSIDRIFAEKGEEAFRQIEKEIFEKILKSASSDQTLFISLGAGFSGDLSLGDEVIWIRRESDPGGRIFSDRPRLNPDLSVLEEWSERYQAREEKYSKSHTQVLTLPEGPWLTARVLRSLFSHWFPSLRKESGFLSYEATLLPEDLKQDRFWKKVFYQGARRIEIRNDLIDQMPALDSSVIYFAHRKNTNIEKRFPCEDWDLSLGRPKGTFWSCSLHEGAFDEALIQSLSQDTVLKWAPKVRSFRELLQGHQWFLEDPERRAFLPRSENGRWRWYRRLFGPQMPIHFVRDHKGSSLDQPFWYETLLPSFQGRGFAAVLGGSVSFSWSPSFHTVFFEKHEMPFVSIDLSEEEFDEGMMVLKDLGLKAAAVTSPLKKKAFEQVTRFSNPLDRELGAINTLFLTEKEVLGINTDLPGVSKAMSKHLKTKSSIFIWGGGGLKPVLERAFPDAVHVKAREGAELAQDSTVLWASTRSPEVVWPKPLHRVKKVLDMNYFENSMGRELALMAGADYVSGEEFFIEQALLQQEFWSRHL